MRAQCRVAQRLWGGPEAVGGPLALCACIGIASRERRAPLHPLCRGWASPWAAVGPLAAMGTRACRTRQRPTSATPTTTPTMTRRTEGTGTGACVCARAEACRGTKAGLEELAV